MRLIERNDNTAAKKGRYVALSYSWGRPPFVTTTLDNIRQHKRGMPVADLPNTIRDAIKVSHKLAIAFLWIDSLCILQGPRGSPEVVEDQNEQFPLMGLVYSNAYVTVISGNTTSVNHSFLAPRTLAQSQWVLLDRSFYDSDREPAWRTPGAKVLAGYDLDRGSWKSTSDTRGWCLQEKTLSKRIISYQDEGIVYACRTTWRSEVDRVRGKTNVFDLNSLSWHLSSKQWKKWFWAGALLSGAGGVWFFRNTWSKSVDWEYTFWISLIQQYTSRALTDNNDKLRAVAGIAEVWQRIFNDEYCAGLWQSVLHFQILWVHSGKKTSDGPKYEVAKTYRAPSWSWANVEGSVHFHFGLVQGTQTDATGPTGLEERAPKLVATRYEQSIRVENFDIKLVARAEVEAFMESTSVRELGSHILGYLRVQGLMRDLNEPMTSWIPVEDGCEPDYHWSGTFFDRGAQADRNELHYIETLRFNLTYPKRGNSAYMIVSSGLVLERQADDAEPGPATLSIANRSVQVEHEGARYRRVGVFWALPCFDNYNDAYLATVVVL